MVLRTCGGVSSFQEFHLGEIRAARISLFVIEGRHQFCRTNWELDFKHDALASRLHRLLQDLVGDLDFSGLGNNGPVGYLGELT